MKVLSTDGLTKLIQLIKSAFISVDDTVSTNTVTLADVATTGDYDDLDNKPTIPTVNNGTLTIQKNGTTIGTFTANQSGNSTVNIEADTVLTDDITISKNSDDELQAIGVIDDNSGNAIKTWTGTKAEYDAMVAELGHPPTNVACDITDDTDVTLSLLELLYPVGAIYIGTCNACPLQVLGIGTWQLVASDRVLQGAGTRGSVGDTLNESLPNITGSIGDDNANVFNKASGVFQIGGLFNKITGSASGQGSNYVDFDASRSSSTYKNGASVQQDAYLVNIWERIS